MVQNRFAKVETSDMVTLTAVLWGRRGFDYIDIDYQCVILMRRADPTQK